MLKQNRLVIGTGLLFLLLSLGHIPVKIFPHAFDKNAPVHFFVLCLISTLFGLQILLNVKRFNLQGLGIYFIALLIITVVISSLLSVDKFGSLIGEAGRYTGAISLFCLIIVGLFHTQINEIQAKKLFFMYGITVLIISILGIFQHFNLIDLPGDSGITSTLGNLDFFAAYVATSLPILIFIWFQYGKKVKFFVVVTLFIELYSLHLAGPLQGFVDIGIIIIALVLYKFRKYIPKFNLTLNAKTGIATLLLIIWLEGIFLMPFLGSFIPVLGNDVQVRIRGQFWLAATNQFFSKPFFGVGPDQYGNYYETYRTLDSVKEYPLILSNDAHSSTVQTLATIGLFGSIAFALLLALLVRSFLIIYQSKSLNRKILFALALYIFVYLTNAAVSPITLPNKYLFWSVSGFIIGLAYKSKLEEINFSLLRKRLTVAIVAVLITTNAFFGINHLFAQFEFMSKWEKFASNRNEKIDIKYNKFLSCTMYYNNIAMMINNQGNQALEDLSKAQVKENSRCVDAQINLAKLNYNKGDLLSMKKNVYLLTEIAPNRSEVLALASVYAAKANDVELAKKVNNQYRKLGQIPLLTP